MAAFRQGRNGHESLRQACINYFRDKCVVSTHNRKYANLTQYKMQYQPYNSAIFAQATLFLTQKALFLPKDLQKVRKSRQILIRDKIAYVWA